MIKTENTQYFKKKKKKVTIVTVLSRYFPGLVDVISNNIFFLFYFPY